MIKIWKSHLYFFVIMAIVIGGVIGALRPELGISLKPLGDGFISLVKMLIGPIVFCTVALGIAGAGSLEKVGKIGWKSLLYFEVVSTFALVIGLMVGNVLKPGSGLGSLTQTIDNSSAVEFTKKAESVHFADTVLKLIPKTFVDAFSSNGELLQILLIAILFGFALGRIGERGKPVAHFLESFSDIFFGMINAVMMLAPLGAGGAMAFTIGKYGVASLKPMLFLMACFYLTCLIFILVVLGIVCRFMGVRITKFLYLIKDELFTVLATSSSESALAPLMKKLQKVGCPRSIVGLVIPAGYSFNLDGTNIYLTLSILFIAQAYGVDLSLTDQFTIMGVAMLTSKGASGVTGAGFITLAATLAVVPKIPISGLALILGIDRFMSEARAVTNIIGNGVAALFISHWEGELDSVKKQDLR